MKMLLFLSLEEEKSGEEDSSIIQTAATRTLYDGTHMHYSFDWKNASKQHSGRSAGAAGQVWNLVKMF